MNNVRPRTWLFVLVLPGLLGILGTPAPAEVGAIQMTDGRVLGYELQGIVDDPEPVGTAWVRHFDDGNGRAVLNDGGLANGDGNPSLVLRSLPGFPMAAWARNTPGGYDIVVSRFLEGAWTPMEFVVDSAADELDPMLVFDESTDTVHLLYWIHDGSPRVMHRQAPSDLSSWSAPTQISQPGEIAVRPSGAMHAGVLLVVYELHTLGYDTTPRQIMLATPQGQVYSSEILATTQHPGENWPQAHSSLDKLWIDWIDTADEVAWSRQLSGGPWEPILTEYFATLEEREYRVRRTVQILAME